MPAGCGLAGVCGLELMGGVMGPWRAGEAALCEVPQRVSSKGMGVGGFSSSDCDRRMLMADSSTYLLRNAWGGKVLVKN